MNNNEVTLTGKVVSDFTFSHELYGEKFYEFNLEIPRLSDTTDILPLTISERLITDKLVPGVFVDVVGQLRSYNNYKGSGNKLKLTIFARTIVILEGESENKNPNQIILNGFICKQPICRKTPFGREIADLILAVNRSYNKSDYVPIITWGRNAKFSEQLKVGDNVKIWGRIQSRPYEKKLEDGTTVQKIAYEVSVSKMEIVDNNNKKLED
jgi:primosomal replication protein N